MKQTLLGAMALIAAPAMAQVQTTPATPAQAPAEVTATADPAATQAAPDAAAPAETAAAQPAPADQVAQVVDQQFASYDKDGDGKLDQTEFGAWMVALKSQSDPRTDANAPATRQWNKAAFAQADTDKSKSLDKAELTGFLTPAAKS